MADFDIQGDNVDGTNSSDYFNVISGTGLSLDAQAGVDFFAASISGEGHATISYNSGVDEFSIAGDNFSVTGGFTSFEDISLSFDASDQVLALNGINWRRLYLDGGDGVDKLVGPNTNINHGRIYLTEQDDASIRITASNGVLPDVSISNFEIFSVAQLAETNLYLDSNLVVKFDELMGSANGSLDTLHIQRGASEVFIWDEGDSWYFGTLGSSEITKLTDFEWLNITADKIYTKNIELFSTEYSDQTLYGIGTIQFYSSTADIRAIDGLNSESFLQISTTNIASFEVERVELGSDSKIHIQGDNVDGTNSSDYFNVISGTGLSLDAQAGVDFFAASISGEGHATISYNSGVDEFSIAGDNFSVTGGFTSFEDISLSFDASDQVLALNGINWRRLYLDGGDGVDKLVGPNTNINHGRIYLTEQDDASIRITASNGVLPDVSISNFEIFSVAQLAETNLYLDSNLVVKFDELMGSANGSLDTLHIQRGASEVFIWDEGDSWYFGTLGSSEITKLTDFEWLNITADKIYTKNIELFSTEYSDQTLYGIGTIQFYSSTADIRAIDGLNSESFIGIHWRDKYDLSGTILSRGDGALSDLSITADLAGSSTDPTTTSSSTGTFTLEIDRGADVNLLAGKTHTNSSPTNAITAEDALDALKLALGLKTADGNQTTLDYLAADFNKNSKVTAQDALDIYKYTLGVGNLDAGWVFVDSVGDYSGISKSNVVYTEGFSAKNMSIDLNVALTGILLGDVDDTYTGYLDIV